MKQSMGAALAAVLLAGGVVGCNSGNNDVDSGTDAGMNGQDAGTCEGEVQVTPSPTRPECVTVKNCAGEPFCPALVTNVATRPKFRVTYINPTKPAALGNIAFRTLLNSRIALAQFAWGMELDLSAAQPTVRTGGLTPNVTPATGQGFFGANFTFIQGGTGGLEVRWNPVTVNATLTGESFTTATIDRITVPIFDEGGALFTELPVREASLVNVTMNTDRNCVGLGQASVNSCNASGQWLSAATPGTNLIRGKITVADARNVMVEVGTTTTTLCGLLSGSTPECAAPTPDSTTSTSEPAWNLEAEFTAIATNIAE